jgi:hypothetical protein
MSRRFETWSSPHTYHLWRYGVGHSELVVREATERVDHVQELHFSGVEMVMLRRVYSGLTIESIPEDRSFELSGAGLAAPAALLYLAISSPSGAGYVACSRLSARVVPREITADDADIAMQFTATADGYWESETTEGNVAGESD